MPKCENQGDYSRGLCPSCYRATLRLVKGGATTWEQLVRDGKALKAKAYSGPRTAAYDAIVGAKS